MKKNTLYILGGLAVAYIAGVFIFKRFSKGKKLDQDVSPELIEGLDENQVSRTISQVGPTTASSVGGTANSIFGFLTNYNDYQVITKTTPLNVRVNPDSKSKIIGTLPKGSKIKGKASGVKGWFDVSKDGKTNYGYVSAEFLKAVPKS